MTLARPIDYDFRGRVERIGFKEKEILLTPNRQKARLGAKYREKMQGEKWEGGMLGRRTPAGKNGRG
jgi:hypothetical protein